MADIENIKSRVSKLFTMVEQGTEAEAHNAMLLAQKLLAKYKLDKSDIETQKETVEVVKEPLNYYYTMYKNAWYCPLWTAIAENYCCRSYGEQIQGSTKVYMWGIGDKKDLAICKQVFKFAQTEVENWFKDFKKRYKHQLTSKELNGFKNTFGIGFAKGLDEKLKQQFAENQKEWGLVMSTPKEANDFVDGAPTRESTCNAVQSQNVRNAGYENGLKTDLGNKLTTQGGKKMYYMEDISWFSRCECGAITIEFNGDDTFYCEEENFGYFFPDLSLNEIDQNDDIANDQLYTQCNHCVNHWGLDLCQCGSGEDPEECTECESRTPWQISPMDTEY